MKAIWNETVVAESDDIETVENNAYFPRASLNSQYFVESDHSTHCPWKGDARYLDVVVKGKVSAAAAWYYPEPLPAAKALQGRVAFWRGVQVLE